MLSTALFDSTGNIYNQAFVFGDTFTVNQTALDIYGLPALTGSNAWTYLSESLAVSIIAEQIVIIAYELLPDWRYACALHTVLGSFCYRRP